MNKDNKNTELDNTDKKLHISDVISSSKNYKWVRGYYFKALVADWIVGGIIAYIFRNYL